MAIEPEIFPFVPSSFQLGDAVFYLEDETVHTGVIDRITMDWRKRCCSYLVGFYTGNHENPWDMRGASTCFRTKQALLESL